MWILPYCKLRPSISYTHFARSHIIDEKFAKKTAQVNAKKVRVFEERSNKLNWRVYRILTHTLF